MLCGLCTAIIGNVCYVKLQLAGKPACVICGYNWQARTVAYLSSASWLVKMKCQGHFPCRQLLGEGEEVQTVIACACLGCV